MSLVQENDNEPTVVFNRQPGLFEQISTFVVSNGASLLQAIQSCKAKSRRMIIKIKDCFKENFWRLLNRIFFGAISGGTLYMLSTSPDRRVEIFAIGGAVVGSFSYHAFETALEENSTLQENHQRERRESEGNHQRERREWETRVSRMEENHQREKTEWETRFSRMEEKHQREKTEWETRFSRMETRFSRMEEKHQQEKREWKEEIKTLKETHQKDMDTLKAMMQQVIDNQNKNGKAQ